jgi:GST-like protein
VRLPRTIEEFYKKPFTHRWAHTETPEAGARFEQPLKEGDAPIQVYTRTSPSSQKVTVLLEELGLKYDAWTIELGKCDQFASGFVAINPNSKVPAMVDRGAGKDGTETVKMGESGAIMLYLAQKTGRFFPSASEEFVRHSQGLAWLFWSCSSVAPIFGQFAFFYKYCERDRIQAAEYGVVRYGMETQRLLSVLENQLAFSSAPDGKGAEREYVLGGLEPTIVDFSLFPHVQSLQADYGALTFLQMKEKYPHVMAWRDRILPRPGVQKGMVAASERGNEFRAFDKSEEELMQ